MNILVFSLFFIFSFFSVFFLSCFILSQIPPTPQTPHSLNMLSETSLSPRLLLPDGSLSHWLGLWVVAVPLSHFMLFELVRELGSIGRRRRRAEYIRKGYPSSE